MATRENLNRTMFLQLHNLPQSSIEGCYRRFPSLKSAPFSQQVEALCRAGTDHAYLLGGYLGWMGGSSQLIFTNSEESQLQWAYERSLLLKYPDHWQTEIALAQVERLAPEVLLISNPEAFDSRFIRMLKRKPPIVVAWMFRPIMADVDLSAFDLVLASHPKILKDCIERAAPRTELLLPFFAPHLPDLVFSNSKKLDLLFLGTWEDENEVLRDTLRTLIREIRHGHLTLSFRIMLSNIKEAPPDIFDLVEPLPSGWLSYFTLISHARQVLHLPTKWQGDFSTSTLTFDSPGLNTRLLAYETAELSDLFEPNIEIDLFLNPDELIS